MSSEIKRLSDDSVRRIVAEQAIVDLSSIVKELVDNALDAESTTIKIRLFGQGMDIVEVSDDGCGVPQESRPRMAERYATSKISSFEDIYSGTGLTMGFRGEALFSLACLSKSLIVATRTEEEPMAQKLEFGKNGMLDSSTVQSIHRKVGTTVAVIEPFAGLPARRTDMMRRIRRERAKLFKLMEAYAIFNVGIQLNLIDISPSGREDTALSTSANSATIDETISSVLGHKFLGSLSQVRISLDDLLKREDNMYNWEISGLITTNPRVDPPKRAVNYFSINGRVVDLPKITSVLKKLWGSFGGKKKPSCILNFTLPNDAFDINLSPDKQQVLLTHEQEICLLVEGHVTKLWASHTQGVFELQQLEAEVDEDVDEDEDAEKQKHKRRFAFVHDLAGAKLQHHSEDRHRNLNLEERKSFDTEETHDGEPVDENPKFRAPKRTKTELNDETRTGDEATDVSLPKRSDGPLTNDSISDMERRKWNAVRSRFNAIDGPREGSLTPVTPESPPQADVYTTPGSHCVSRPSVGVEWNQPQRLKEPSQTRKQTLLKQFAFTSTTDIHVSSITETSSHTVKAPEPRQPQTTSNRRSMYEGDEAAPTDATSDAVAAKKAASSVEDGDTFSGQSTNGGTRATAPLRLNHQKNSTTHVDSQSSALVEQPTDLVRVDKKNSTTHVDIQSAALVEQPTNLETNLSTNAGTETTVVEKRNEQSAPLPIAWDTFKSTEDVCREARLERLQMMKRKLDFQRAESYANEVIPSDIGDSPLSVGTSKSKTNGTKINLSKEQFRDGMEILGQFNMGFILARCQKNHLWILDQHACDEKYNFEKLCRDTIIHEQKLLHPMPLDLSPAEESCILDHIEIFEANGFRFNFDASARIRHRLSLTALPHSGARDGRKAVQFNKDDVSTLCSILMDGASYDAGDGGTGTDGTGRFGNNAVRRYASTVRTKPDSSEKIIARLPKAIAMFASRACRSSIMIGTALSQKEMDRIVRRLADVEHPWNCPHGRPTMRHVGEVLSTFKRDERRAVEYFSGPTITLATMTQEPIDGDEPDGTAIEPHFSSGQA